MRLQIGFTLTTAFLALFTMALWKEWGRKGKEGEKEEPGHLPEEGTRVQSKVQSDAGLMAA